jgi:hypothetical protein
MRKHSCLIVATAGALLAIGCSQSRDKNLSSLTVAELAEERKAIALEIAEKFGSATPEESQQINERSDELLAELQRRWPSQSNEYIEVARTTDDPTLIAVLIRIASQSGPNAELHSLVRAGLLRESSSIQGGDVSIRTLALAASEYLSSVHESMSDEEIVAFVHELFSANERYREHVDAILGKLPADKASQVRGGL